MPRSSVSRWLRRVFPLVARSRRPLRSAVEWSLEDRFTPSLSLVRDINALGDTGGSEPAGLVEMNGSLFFSANTQTLGQELYMSDGTSSGTVLVRDISAGSLGSSPQYLTNVGGVLYFQAIDGTAGEELWRSDGTSSGTNLFADIEPGSGGSNPSRIIEFGGSIYFTATTEAHGRELWRYDPPVVAPVAATVDDGTAQRSMVRSVTLTFAAPLPLAASLANVVITRDGGLTGTLALVGSLDATGTVLTVTFAGSAIVGGSLPDGRYTLTYGGIPVLDGTTFYRLYGDANGDRAVNFADFLAFRTAFGSTGIGNPFDHDGDGTVNFTDFLAFRTRFGSMLP